MIGAVVHSLCGCAPDKLVEKWHNLLKFIKGDRHWRKNVQLHRRFSTSPVDDTWVSVWTTCRMVDATRFLLALAKISPIHFGTPNESAGDHL